MIIEVIFPFFNCYSRFFGQKYSCHFVKKRRRKIAEEIIQVSAKDIQRFAIFDDLIFP